MGTRKMAEEPTPKADELKCGCCGQPLNLDEGDDPSGMNCHGCKQYICGRDTCSASTPFGPHKPWQHKPCDTCGESVMDEGAQACENCL